MNASKTVLLSAAALLAVLLAPEPARGAAGEWQKNPQSSVRLITPWTVAPRSGELILGLQFRLAPGWHVYWKNSGDAGFPPAVTFQPERILGKPELLWPQPSRFELPGGLVAFGYEDEVVYPVAASIQPGSVLPPSSGEEGAAGESFRADSFRITADLDYLVCEVDCVPYRYTLTLDQRTGFPALADGVTGPLLDTWLARLPRRLAEVPGVKVSTVLDAGRPGAPDFEVRLAGVEEQPGKTDLFLESHEALDAGKPRLKPFPGGLVFHVPMKPRDAGKPLPEALVIGWTATNLSKDGRSFDLAMRHAVQVVTTPAAQAPVPAKAAEGSSHRLARLLLWAFLGGALLSLTPTVLALLAGEALALRAGAAGVRDGAAAAATGVIGACWAAAGLALLAHRSGVPSGWGAQLQEPALAALMAVASALLALNLWGLVEAPLAPAGSPPAGTGRHLLAGMFTVPLALAWPVPMLQEPIGYAFERGPAAVCALYSVIGFGLALPYLVLTAAPAAVRLLPAPGPLAAAPARGAGVPGRGEHVLAALRPLPPGQPGGARRDRARAAGPGAGRLAEGAGGRRQDAPARARAGPRGVRRSGPLAGGPEPHGEPLRSGQDL